MHEKKLKEELVRVVHHEVGQHFRRVMGSDVRCYVTADLSAVTGEIVKEGTIYRFSIPVVVIAEHPAQVAGGPMDPNPLQRR